MEQPTWCNLLKRKKKEKEKRREKKRKKKEKEEARRASSSRVRKQESLKQNFLRKNKKIPEIEERMFLWGKKKGGTGETQ